MPSIKESAPRLRRAAAATFVVVASACGGGSTGPDNQLSITTDSLPSAVQGAAYSHDLEATGGGGAYSWTVATGALPVGLSLDPSSGVIAGTPTQAAAADFTVQITSADGQAATRQFTMDVFAELAIETVVLPSAREASAYTQSLSATGGNGSYTWTTVAGSLPSGLTIGATTGAITGTPVTVQSGTFTVRVQSGDGQTAQRELSIAVFGVLVVAATVPNAVEGVPYAHSVGAGGGDGIYSWSIVAGTLPAGLSLSAASGVLSGVPTTLGSSGFTVKITSGDGQSAQAPVSMGVYPRLGISTDSVTDGKQGVAYSDAFVATGGNGAYTWSISTGTLPAGLTLGSGTGSVTGTPTAVESRTFSVAVASGDGQSAQGGFSIAVNPLVLLPTELCSENPSTAHVTFADQNLATKVRQALGVSSQAALTCALLAPPLLGLNAGNAGIASLAGIQNLVGLQNADLADNSISDLAPIASLTQLEGLNLSGNPLATLAPLSGLTKISLLFAEGSQVSDITPLAGLTALEQLELGNNSIDDISALSGLTDLGVLDLAGNDVADLAALTTLAGLTWVNLSSNSITDAGPLAGLSALETLHLKSNSVADLGPLSGLTTLAVLDLAFNDLTNITALAGTSGLTHLNIQGNAITDIAAVASMSMLESLVAMSNDITDISALAGLTSLIRVALDDNANLEDIQPLIDNPGIGVDDLITLDGTDVTCADISTLQSTGATVIHNCPTG